MFPHCFYSHLPPPTYILTAYAQGSSELKDLSEVRNLGWNTDGSTLEVSSIGDMAQLCYLSNLDDSSDDYIDLSGKTIELTNDIDLTGIDWPGIILGKNSVFDGNGHTVTIEINEFEHGEFNVFDYIPIGLFSMAYEKSEITNLTVDGSITDPAHLQSNSVGPIVGMTFGTISNCVSNVDMKFDSSDQSFIGGICGYSEGDIINCVFNGSITVTGTIGGSEVAGICADAEGGKIELCKNHGNISCGDINFSDIGGIIGITLDTHILNCLNAGTILLENATYSGNIGGLLGCNSVYATESEVIIENCLNTGEIKFTSNNNLYTGAIVGFTDEAETGVITKIINSYAITDNNKKLTGSETNVNIDTKSGFVDEVNSDLADKLNDGQDKDYWEITDDGDISFNIKDDEDDNKDDVKDDDEPKTRGSSYSLEEKKGGSHDDEDEPVISEPEKKDEITDISGHWAEPYITAVVENGYMSNIVENQFFPDSPASRLTVAEALYRIAGSPSVSMLSPFTDSSDSAAIWAGTMGILAGFEDGTVRPDETVTREQLAVIIYNYQKAAGKDVSNIEGMRIYEYSDYESISEWAFTAVRYCLNTGILNGGTDGEFNPKGNVTRAELAVIINNLA